MFTLLLWTHWLLVGQVAAPASVNSELAAQVRQLVRKLNAEELADRDAAQQALVKLGPAALPHLPNLDARTPADVAARLGQVRQALLAAQAAVAGQAVRVTLKGEFALSQLLAELARQTGNKIVDHRKEFGEEQTDPKQTVEFDKTPFWQALDAVLDQANLTVYNYAGASGIHVVSRPANQLPRAGAASISGPFRIEATRFEAARDLRNPAGQSLKLFLDVAWEPRLAPILISQPLDTVRALGSGGVPIAVEGSEGEPEATIGGDVSSVELQIPLQLPQRSVAKIASLRGKLEAIVPASVETFRFDQLPISKGGPVKPVEIRKAGVTVFVDQVRKNDEIWEVRMRVKFDEPSKALESHRGWMLNNEAYLVGADNRPIKPGGFEQTRQTKDEFGLMYLFELDDAPAALAFVYRTPLAMLNVPIEYELKDLDLP